MRRIITLLIPLSVVVFSLLGCYTILKHPQTEENYTARDYQNNCISCHTDYHEYPYGYFYGNYPDYWWSTPRWGHYYAYPWWWDYYWYDGEHHQGGYVDDGSPRPEEGEKAVRRDALRPPYTGPTSVIPSFRGSSPASSGNAGTKPSTPDNPPGDKPSENKKKDDANSGKKAPRRGGRE